MTYYVSSGTLNPTHSLIVPSEFVTAGKPAQSTDLMLVWVVHHSFKASGSKVKVMPQTRNATWPAVLKWQGKPHMSSQAIGPVHLVALRFMPAHVSTCLSANGLVLPAAVGNAEIRFADLR